MLIYYSLWMTFQWCYYVRSKSKICFCLCVVFREGILVLDLLQRFLNCVVLESEPKTHTCKSGAQPFKFSLTWKVNWSHDGPMKQILCTWLCLLSFSALLSSDYTSATPHLVEHFEPHSPKALTYLCLAPLIVFHLNSYIINEALTVPLIMLLSSASTILSSSTNSFHC